MKIHNSWHRIVEKSLKALDKEYLEFLQTNKTYFPNKENFLNAFKTLPQSKTKAILFGQDPYPREKSAVGYAFIDGMVEEIFSDTGFSKRVNRATSLRNFLKMQLSVEGFLNDDVSQEAIAKTPKDKLINSIYELKNNFEKEGILLLNRALVFTSKTDSRFHIKQFRPFMKTFLQNIAHKDFTLILFGNEAKTIETLLPSKHNFTLIKTPHPYNVSFIKDEDVKLYFSQLKLIQKQ